MKLLRHYLQVFLPLMVAFATYQLLAVPLLEPLHSNGSEHWLEKQEPISLDSKWWEPYFIATSWQRNNPLVIERDECILLYQTREQISDTRWRFKPLTIVVPQRSADGNQRAIFIENPKGAEIQFKKPFDWASGNPPPIVSGQLLGEIKIYAPADASSNSGELLIETKDMRIDRRQVWTTEAIKMRIGNSYVEGRYLSIYMDRDLLSEQTMVAPPDPTPFPGLDYLELFYVDRVDMALPAGGLWPSQQNDDSRQRPASASLRCGGTFGFQFHQLLATLKNGVHMEHRVEGLPVDTFDCHELKLTLGLPSPDEKRDLAPDASNEKWKIDRLEAVGAPGRDYTDQSHWVQMKAPGMQAEAHGQYLLMDFVHGMVTLSNALPGTAPRNSSRVHLRRESLQVSSPQVQLQNPDLIQTSRQKGIRRLGWMIADGIGIAQMDSSDDSWALRWSKRLVIRPHEERDVIQIEGGANISSTQRGRFIAENLTMWIVPVAGELAERLKSQYPDGNGPAFVPDVIHAKGDVMVNSPELHAQVDEMTIRFRYPTTTPKIQFPAASLPQHALSSTSHISVPNGPPSPIDPLTDEASSAPITATQSKVLPTPLPRANPSPQSMVTLPNSDKKLVPLHVRGKMLEAQIIRSGQESNVESLTIEGQFQLTREPVSEDLMMPLNVTGERLVLKSESNDLTNIHLVGQPARVAIGSGWIISDELQLSQSDQLFWVDHPGELVIPTEAIAPSPGSALQPAITAGPGLLRSDNGGIQNANGLSSITWRSPPRLQWGEYMTFDGKLARFGGGVTLDCRMQTAPDTLWHILASSSTLTLEMASQIPLRYQGIRNEANSPLPLTSKPELRIASLDGDVDIKAVQTDLQGSRQSAENLLVPHLEFNLATQTWIGLGPGQLLSRRLGQANPMASSVPSLGGPKAPGPSLTGPTTLQCLHLTFLGRVEGSMQQRMVSFYDKIDSLLGPIKDWNGAVDVRYAETLGPNQSRLLCDQLNLFDSSGLSYNQNRMGPKQAAWEIDALGNAQLASRTDSGDVVIDGNRIGYAALEDMVRIEGSSRRAASIRRIPIAGQQGEADEFQVSSATMRLKTGQLDAQIRRIEGAVPPQFQRPVDTKTQGAPSPQSQQGTPNAPGSALPSPRDFNPLQPRGNGR
jgi:hypothetical protein